MRTLTNTLAALAVAAGVALTAPAAHAEDRGWDPAEVVGVVGDSNTWGYGARVSYGEVAHVAHYGVPGACTSSRRCDAPCDYDVTQNGRCGADTWIRTALEEMGHPTTLVILLGSNDLLGGALPATIKSAMRTLRKQAYRLGVERVAFGTIPPLARWHSSDVFEQRRGAVNDWIRANDHVDYAAALENADGFLSPRYDAGDGLHLSTLAHRVMARTLVTWTAE